MAAPDARTDNYSVTEDQLLVGSANGFLNNDSDLDGDPLSIILIDGLPFSFGTPITLASGAKLTINADGSFQYDQNGSFTHLSAGQTVNDIFTYTISDGRLGFDTSAVCITISGVTRNPNPILPQPLIINGAISDVVEEEHGLPGGIEDTTDSNGLDTDESGPNTVTNASAGSFVPLITGGIDGTLSFAFAPLGGNPAVQTVSNGPLTSHGKQVYFDTEGPNLIGYYNANGDSSDYDAATDTKVFTMTLVSTGAYTFTLHAPVDHPIGGEDSIAINLNGRVTVTDSGGPGADTNVPLNASITVIDDTPDAVVANTTAAAIVLDESPLGRRPGTASGLHRTANFSRQLCAPAFRRRRGDGSVSYALAFDSASIGQAEPIGGLRPRRGWLDRPGSHVTRELADVNGDGMADIVGFGQAGVYVSLATGNGHFAAPTFELAAFAPGAGGWSSDDLYKRELADVNGDGRADIVGFGQAGVYVSLATGNGHFAAPTFELAAFAPGAGGWISDDLYTRELADVNGDGKADIVGFGQAGVYVSLATGNGHFAAPTFELAAFAPGAGGWSSDDLYQRELADVNGDGRADIVGFGQAGVYVSLATGNGHFAAPTFELAAFAPGAGGWSSDDLYPRELADVNGDGMADIVGFGQAGVYVSLATGNGHFAAPTFELAAFAPGAGGWSSDNLYKRELADVNGDGKADIVASVLVAFTNILALHVPSGLFALDATDTSAGDGDGIGQGAQIVLNQVRQRRSPARSARPPTSPSRSTRRPAW